MNGPRRRFIFTLLYDDGFFVQSRNFRLQKVGDIAWLKRAYDITTLASSVDELIILDVTRSGRDYEKFSDIVSEIGSYCFAPIAAGGGLLKLDDARSMLAAGADKVVINTGLTTVPGFAEELAGFFGQQSVVGSLDVKRTQDGSYNVYVDNGTRDIGCLTNVVSEVCSKQCVGELYLNSIDRDGTGMGLDLDLLALVGGMIDVPIIVCGGVGHSRHIIEGLSHPSSSGVATANLLNFLGRGLPTTRTDLASHGCNIAHWAIELPEISR